ncbi:MAG: ACT domain-containing protein [Anaerolineae bacterium]|nr:ACT domain-containing protein [Anaerolineae bacterium]
MPQTINEILAGASLYTDDQPYTLIKLSPHAIMAAAGVIAEVGEPFSALLVDKDEVTLLIPQEAVADFARRLPGYEASATSYRLITFDVVLEPDLVGFMAVISTALAEAGVSILPFAAYSRDHLFVAEADFAKAMDTLRRLQS